jgi:serine/threonine protein kinase
MSNRDAGSFAEHAVQLGLLTESQLKEAQAEVEDGDDQPERLLRTLERKGHLTPWQSQKLIKGDKDGYFLGGYRLLYRIAAGSFGRVFRADDPHTGNIVAIKVLRRRWSEQRRTIELFEREGKVGLSLRHPNIVSVLAVDFDEASRQYYIVMEFIEGGNLRDFLAIRKKLSCAEALRWIEDCANGLAHAYAQGVTHRDIKPSNILISSTQTAKLVDFGLADIYTPQIEDNSKVYRTVDYAGLERATGSPPGDVRSDIYFLGCTLYEALTGKSPLFMTPDLKARMRRERFLNCSALHPGDVQAPPSVYHLIETMMAFNPQHRYQTPSQLVEAVRHARRDVEGQGPADGVQTPTERSVFIVEKNHRLQDALRDNIKKLGYRVFLSANAPVALERYRHKPYDALIMDAAGGEEDSLLSFEHIIREANRKKRPLGAILLLNKEQADWTTLVPAKPHVVALVRPIKLGQVVEKLTAFVPIAKARPPAAPTG